MDLHAASSTQWLGATIDRSRGGTNFVFYTSKDATRVELCLFDKAKDAHESQHHDMVHKEAVKGDDGEVIGYLWHGFAPVGEGKLYGFRVHGPYDPEHGQFFNPNKLLLDPAAKEVTGEIHTWDQRHFHHDWQNPGAMDVHNNGDIMPKARVIDWQKLHAEAASVPPGELFAHPDSRILEMHVGTATAEHPDIPEAQQGTYKALTHKAFLHDFVKEQGHTTLELQPVESFGTDAPLAERGKKNHWGYMTMAPMAPHTGYAATDHPAQELMETIRTLKQNQVEVVLDVVPNHTLEGGPGGPLVHLRGQDSSQYLPFDITGTGNTRDFGHPMNRRLFLEELKYWRRMGVSGFRIDLATVIGREKGGGFDPNAKMMQAIREDPELKDVKFYGEPWDLGLGASMREQVGRLAQVPPERADDANHIAEWHPVYRDTIRDAALNHDVDLPRSALMWLMSGSAGLYADPTRVLNKLGSHDGPSLHDEASWQGGKNNHVNGEGNRDGNDIDPRHYWGNEADRLRAERFGIALLAVSEGTPMLLLGDDRCHSNDGNTNGYCKNPDPAAPENRIANIKWNGNVPQAGHEMMEFTRMANRFRDKHAALRRARSFEGSPDTASGLNFAGETMKDVTWLDPAAQEFRDDAKNWPGGFGMMLSGDPGNSRPQERVPARRVQREHGDPLLVLVNPTMQDIEFTVPDVPGVRWKKALNSLDPKDVGEEIATDGERKITVGFHSLVAFEGSRMLARTASDRLRDQAPHAQLN